MYIASGSADKVVSLWTWELSQKYTFTHVDSIQAVEFNPVAPSILATASCSDFAIWTMPSTSLRKIKVHSRVCSLAWTTDGDYLAIGMYSGLISIRDTNGVEKMTILRSAPVWDMSWTAPKASSDDQYDTLAVACWDGTLSFYSLTGAQIGKDRALEDGVNPCSVKHYGNGDYIVVAGSDRKATLHTRDGIKLSVLAEAKDWIWKAIPRPKSNSVAIVTNDGSLSLHSIVFSTVHGLYGDRYAFRDGMTDVVVQHLVVEARARIKTRDYVKKIAVYRNRLAVQLPDRVIIYEIEGSKDDRAHGKKGDTSMQYKVKARIMQSLECNLLVVTSNHVILCLEKKLTCYSFAGVKVREWVLDSLIRYIKVAGGPPGREGLLVGLKSGAVLKIFINRPLPLPLIKHKAAIRCLDLSLSRRRLAVVDEASLCAVYDLAAGGELIFTEEGANSVAWNAEQEHMLCFSGGGTLSIKTGNFPLHVQKLSGFVVGFSGSKAFVLQSPSMVTLDVPQSASVYRYMEIKDWEMAYRTACLGVPDSDWQLLGESALRAMELTVARAAFLRLNKGPFLDLINAIEAQMKKSKNSHSQVGAPIAGVSLPPALSDITVEDAPYVAEALSYQGKYVEAGKVYLMAGMVSQAMEMFSDLRLWSEAREFAEEVSSTGLGRGTAVITPLLQAQAAWCEERKDFVGAANIYVGLGQPDKAVRILGEQKLLIPELLELVRTFPTLSVAQTSDTTQSITEASLVSGSDKTGANYSNALEIAGLFFQRAGHFELARETLLKLGDSQALLRLAVNAGQWTEALTMAKANLQRALAKHQISKVEGGQQIPEIRKAHQLVNYVHISKGNAHQAEGQYKLAVKEFEHGSRPDLAALIFERLAAAAVLENRFSEAAVYYHRLALDSAAQIREGIDADTNAKNEEHIVKYRKFAHFSHVYSAYSIVYANAEMPVTAATPETVFYTACCLLNSTVGKSPLFKDPNNLLLPPNISVMRTLFVLARHAKDMGAIQLARNCVEAMKSMLIPDKWQDTVDHLALSIQTGNARDKEGLSPPCTRCGNALSLSTADVASITSAQAPSTYAFDLSLPLLDSDPTTNVISSAPGPSPFEMNASGYGDICVHCAAPIFRSILTFEPLPLVEFVPSSSWRDALPLLLEEPVDDLLEKQHESERNVIKFTSHDTDTSGDAQFRALLVQEASKETANLNRTPFGRKPVVVPHSMLRKLNPTAIVIVRPYLPDLESSKPTEKHDLYTLLSRPITPAEMNGIPPRFLYNLNPQNVPITSCLCCGQLFHSEDLEFEVLKKNMCPFCSAPANFVGI